MENNRPDVAFLSSGGQASLQIAAKDWSDHPMGDLSTWPSACRTALSIVLNSGFPSYILWGPQFYFFYNDAYGPILGNKVSLGQGIPLADLWSEIRDDACHIANLALAGEASFFKDRPFLLNRFGDPQEGHFTFSYSPIRDAEGAAVGVICTIVETTESVIAVEKSRASAASIRENEHRFRALVNSSADVIYRMSPDWKYMHELDGRGFLKTTTGMGEYRIEEYVYPDDLDLARNAISAAIQQKTTFELEHRVLRTDGSHGWTYSRAVPLLDDKGEIYEWIGLASDITVRKLAEEHQAEASRHKDDFLAMLGHELRNPLAPIKSAAQLLQLATLDKGHLRSACQIIDRQVTHMTNLVDELLDASRVSRNLVTIDAVEVDIREVVAHAIEQVKPLMNARHHQLKMALSAENAFVRGDKKRLVQVITNLLNNAAKYTPEGGKILLRTDVLEEQIRIEVIDNGFGMTPYTIKHAFELFSQAERNSDRSSGGLGLGLALVKNIVELHGGTVRAKSEGLGRGTQFSVHLPRVLVNTLVETIQPSATSITKRSPSLRIMVVDDNEDAAVLLALLLETLGHEVAIEQAAEQAIDRAIRDLPDVGLLDIGLPGMDGYELAQRLRGRKETAHMLLVAITGYGQAHDRIKSSASGFDHHMVKPVDIEQLNSILSNRSHKIEN